LNSIKIFFIILIVIIAIVLIIKSTIDGALVQKKLKSVYIKILLNQLQLIILTASFNFDWPSNVEGFFNSTRTTSEVTTQIFSIDCFLDQRENGSSSNFIKLYYQKMIMLALFPILLTIG